MATAIFLIAIVPLLSLFFAGAITVEGAGSQTTAVNLAREKMEELKGQGFYVLYLYYLEDGRSPKLEDEIDAYLEYSRKTTVQLKEIAVYDKYTTSYYVLELLHLEVSVFWQEREKELGISVQSYLGRR